MAEAACPHSHLPGGLGCVVCEALAFEDYQRTLVRDCMCNDPENCTEAVRGYRCKAGRTVQDQI